MGKYVAVGVLAVIVLAAATYEAPPEQGKKQQTDASVTGTYGGEAETANQPNDNPKGEVPIGIPGVKKTPVATNKAELALPNKPSTQAREEILQYTVKAGETLRDVAKKLIGDASRWREIYAANKDKIGADPNQLRKGMVLVWKKVERGIATLAAARRGQSRSVPASVPRKSTSGQYVVAKGDTLYAIATRKLGKGSRYKEIMQLNGLKSPTLRAGQRLKLPPR